MVILTDACPCCPPGFADAALPVGDVIETASMRVADYECGSCGSAWTSSFDRHGFVIDRLPVVSGLAAPHSRRSAA